MEIKYSWLQSFFNEKLPEPEKLADVLTMRSLEVESVKEENGDFVFDIAMLPSRKDDYVTHYGVIRDISAILKIDYKKEMIEEVEEKDCEKVFLKTSDVEKTLGAKLEESEMLRILSDLGFKTKKINDVFEVFVPGFRKDIEIKEDLVEEIARIYGYENIEAKMPEGMLVPPKRNNTVHFVTMVKNILKGLGYSEVYNYSFSSLGDFELENPIAKGKEFMRVELVSGLEKNSAENSKNFKEIKIFELGKIFPAAGERLSLAVLSNKADFYEMKGVAEAVLIGLGISDFYFKDSGKKVAEVYADDKVLCHIDHNTFEFDFDALASLANENIEFRPISKYPIVSRDIAIFVPSDVKIIQVMDVIENTGGELLIDTDLFDIFEKEGKKSLAFRLMFQSQDKTLTDDEVNVIRDKIFMELEAFDPRWEIRR